MIKERLSELIKVLFAIKVSSELSISDEVLFSEACSFLRGELVNQNRQNWQKPVVAKQESSVSPSSLDPVTERQLEVIYENNLDVDTKNLTKLEAQKIIGKFFEQKNKESQK